MVLDCCFESRPFLFRTVLWNSFAFLHSELTPLWSNVVALAWCAITDSPELMSALNPENNNNSSLYVRLAFEGDSVMARIKLQLPDEFNFSTDLDVRVSDINYGNHLGNDRMVTLLHEARLRFLAHYEFAELNIGGLGMMVTDLAVTFNAESFMGDTLTFHVGLTEFSKYGCDVIYRVENKAQGKKIAEAKTGIVFFDYDERRIARIPKVFYSRCAPHLLEERNKTGAAASEAASQETAEV